MGDRTGKQGFNLSTPSWVSIIVGLIMFVIGFVLSLNTASAQQRMLTIEAKNTEQDSTDKEMAKEVSANTISVNVIITKLDSLGKDIAEVKSTVKQIQRAQ